MYLYASGILDLVLMGKMHLYVSMLCGFCCIHIKFNLSCICVIDSEDRVVDFPDSGPEGLFCTTVCFFLGNVND